MSTPTIGGIANWYGSNRKGAARVGELLTGCHWVGIPFCGGCCEVPYITARTIVANDLHRDIINLANVIADSDLLHDLSGMLSGEIFHPDTLTTAQAICGEYRKGYFSDAGGPSVRRAWAFFICAWMTRSGTAGTNGETTGKLCLRWEAGGGDSAKRWRSAIDSLPAWHEHLKRCTFSTLDFRDFLAKCKDRSGHGIYCDPPFPGRPGEKYSNSFTEDDHRELAGRLVMAEQTRVVIRYYDVPLIRELYPESDGWTWHEWEGRKQTNDAAPEVLIVGN